MTCFGRLALWTGAETANHLRLWTASLSEVATHDFLSAVSLSLQIAVAAYALWLNRVFGTKRAGWALCGAFILMLVMHINEAFSPPVTVSALGLRPELAYLFISLLLLLGLSHLATLYRERQLAESAIRKARDELEMRVRERTAELAGEVEQRKQAEAEIRSSQQLYRGLVDSLDGIIFECQADDLSFTFVSPQSERLLGFAPDQWLRQINWQTIIHPDDYRQFAETWARAVQDKSGASLEFRVLAKDKRTRWVRHLASVVAGPHGQFRIRGVLLDVTERKQLEDELRHAQKMEAVGRLSGGVAHDFNNILTAIQGYGGLLLAIGGSTGEAAEYLKRICEAAARGEQLTSQLLAFSRKQEMRLEPADLNKVVESTAKMAAVLLGEDIALCQQLAEELPPVLADTGQLTQVLMNLAVNARDAMRQGGQLAVKTEAVSFTDADRANHPEIRAGLFVCLSVSDTGTGISADVLPHIFEPFFTTKEVGKGTGLGLSTVYGTIKQHGGWIHVDTAPGQGTTFRLFLPASDAPVNSVVEKHEPCERAGDNETILLVEDDALVLQMTSSVLQAQGYQVLEANSGPVALRLWAQHRNEVDLLLTDVVMPDGMSGWEVVERLRADNPRLKAIAMSGYAPEEPSGLEFAFLRKPYLPQTLLKSVSDALQDANQPA
jgi:two-component system, cell cycle sensor histidine kinase and response regulator CckA